MTNNLNHPEFKTPSQEEVDSLKITFGALDFKERLLFWDSKNWDWRLVTLFSISVEPKDEGEKEILYKWRLEHIQKLSKSFEDQLEKKFYHDTKISKRPKDYAKNRLVEINDCTDREMSLDEEGRFLTRGYIGAVDADHPLLKNESAYFHEIAFPYAIGIALAEYKNFLEERIERETISNKTSNGILENLTWNDNNLTEMSELIYALSKSNRILKNGKPIPQTELIKIFETLFCADLKNMHSLIRAAKPRISENSTIIAELLKHIKEYAEK